MSKIVTPWCFQMKTMCDVLIYKCECALLIKIIFKVFDFYCHSHKIRLQINSKISFISRKLPFSTLAQKINKHAIFLPYPCNDPLDTSNMNIPTKNMPRSRWRVYAVFFTYQTFLLLFYTIILRVVDILRDRWWKVSYTYYSNRIREEPL